MIKGVKRRQNIVVAVGVLFSKVVACTGMILLQDRSNECKKKNQSASIVFRISAFGFPVFFAVHIAFWLTIYSLVLKRRQDEKKYWGTKEERTNVMQVSYVNASVSISKYSPIWIEI